MIQFKFHKLPNKNVVCVNSYFMKQLESQVVVRMKNLCDWPSLITRNIRFNGLDPLIIIK